jgi:heme A synthase
MITLLAITVLSLAVAAIMSVVAWRLARDERRRSEARVEALAEEIRADEPPLLHVGEYLPPEAPARTQGSLAAALAIGVFFVGSVVGLAVVFSNGARNSTVAPEGAAGPAQAAQTATSAVKAPLELMALSHERDDDRLIVRGAVRSPLQGDAGAVTAIVSAFDRAGALVASGRAPIETGAGVESTFAVTITGVDALHRYRVSFRSDDRAVAHVDRRKQANTVQLP